MTVYQHFRKHEHPFIDQVLSWKDFVEKNYTPYVSDFLDPREQKILGSLIGTTNEMIKFAFSGGAESTERKRAIIAPFYEEIEEDYFEISLLEAHFDEKFNQLNHRDILGAIMSLGVERKKIGDIIVANDRFQFILANELCTYMIMNLTKIKNATIKLKEISFSNIMDKQEKWIDSHHTVSSMRLDIVVKEIYRLSRKDAVHLIKGNRVKVNFTDVDDPAINLYEDDLISVRGYGRSKIITINGKTRKDKIKVTTARLKG